MALPIQLQELPLLEAAPLSGSGCDHAQARDVNVTDKARGARAFVQGKLWLFVQGAPEAEGSTLVGPATKQPNLIARCRWHTAGKLVATQAVSLVGVVAQVLGQV